MPSLIIIRLHPVSPTTGSDFTSYLNNLTIKAFDLSLAESKIGDLIGQASGVWTPPSSDPTDPGLHSININNTQIIQHFSIVTVSILPFVQQVEFEAVATAVIRVSPPAGHPEYQTSDVRLEITNNGKKVIDQNLDFNVVQESMSPLSNDPSDYIAFAGAIFLGIPDPNLGLGTGAAFVDLPEDGSAPKFKDVFDAVNLVLAQDPGAGATLATKSPLNAAEARQVAREIIWNRSVHPAPGLPISSKDSTSVRTLEEMYTRPPTSGISGDDLKMADMDRKQFEATLTGFYATQNAHSERLAQYVFAVSAAVYAEKLSKNPTKAGFLFPPDPGQVNLSATLKQAQVALLPDGAFTLNFDVPTDYFYALSMSLGTTVSADQRYRMATIQDEQRIISEIYNAKDLGIIDTTGLISPENAARRLVALGLANNSGLAQVKVNTDINALLTAWLAFMAPNIADFWSQNPFPFKAGHLDVVLAAVTQQVQITANSTTLINDIKAMPVAEVADIKSKSTLDWKQFFLGPPTSRVALLPLFTAPGTPEERVLAFVRQLKKFFDIQTAAQPLLGPAPGTLPIFDIATDDPINRFIGLYNANPVPPFAFGAAWNSAAFTTAVQDTFPNDPSAQNWLTQVLNVINDLFTVTNGVGPAKLHFSLIEALYSRGFTSNESIQALSPGDFERALTGTIAYPFANQIYVNAGGSGGSATPGAGSFEPINSDGFLINCIPPWHLSPLGPVEYLHELLLLSAASTCDQPTPGGQTDLAELLKPRRGPLGDLSATAANVHTALPLIDIVNENLEALAAGATAGVVYDTNGSDLAGHAMLPAGPEAPKPEQKKPFLHDPTTLFAAIPEHSTPATPVALPNAYTALASTFTDPKLPYAQPLDISRSYLRKLGTSRFQTMRTFREAITEFVIDPSLEATDFRSFLWRYPVRIEIAREYLGISPDEYDLLYSKNIALAPAPAQLVLHELYGFVDQTIDGKNWTIIVVEVPEFLKRTGLTYCEFLELWHSKFVEFQRAGKEKEFPQCEPCCPELLVIDFINPSDANEALTKLIIFIRLWRSLRIVRGARYSFTQLADICNALKLFNGTNINPDFIRELAAFQMLRDDLHLSLGTSHDSGATGVDRTRILGMWAGQGAPSWDWAVEHLLGRIEDYAEAHHAKPTEGTHHRHRPPEFMKIIEANLDSLSSLIGFDPTTPATWDAKPTSTLRFVEVLTKLYLSAFTTGELLYLFNIDIHLDGDDPFPEQDKNEALDAPFNLPEENHAYGLWELRRKLLEVEIPEEEIKHWSWHRITSALRDEFGYDPSAGTDYLQSIGEHFFSEMLSHLGMPVSSSARHYVTPLTPTKAGLWNAPPDGPFQYDSASKQLFMQLPLRDEEVNRKLNHLDQLTDVEQKALQQLYFAPRADLAPFAYLFENFGEAELRLIEEPNERERWKYFQASFAKFYARCRVIAEHLAGHVSQATDREDADSRLAWALLKRLLADENRASGPWEQDNGELPASNLWTRPNGGAFAALLGLIGTGLLGKFSTKKGVAWEEVRGPMSAFTKVRDEWNTPFPTILPALDLALLPEQLRLAVLRNGLALRESDGERLGGAEAFQVVWSGVLIIDKPGQYRFFAGAPSPRGQEPDFDRCAHNRWRIAVQRGQKSWLLLNHRWKGEGAPDQHSEALYLRRGAYFLTVEFAQGTPEFKDFGEVHPTHTGFEVKYVGPDSGDELIAVPADKLFRDVKDGAFDTTAAMPDSVQQFLKNHYTSTIRDIRRTYQRSFKALLFAHRLRLDAKPRLRHSISEIDFLLNHPKAFAGASYFPPSPGVQYQTHQAYFDFNFLPILDLYKSPSAAQDGRTAPSLKRRQALFDWWERLFDYTRMRDEVSRHSRRLAWLLFVEAEDEQPTDLDDLFLHLGVDIDHAALLTKFYDGKSLVWSDLIDERWTLRTWHADRWIRGLLGNFVPLAISDARPDLWAGDDTASLANGNANLTKFYQDGCIENGDPRRYDDIRSLNDGLRERARAALFAYLCGMNRVTLPDGSFATNPKDLSALLLIDVETGLCQKASRIEEAITAVQLFVERARLGLEPTFPISAAFANFWDSIFHNFRTWQACRRRLLYRENSIEWMELEKAQKTEAFRFLESELRRITLTAPIPGGLEYWPKHELPAHCSLIPLQYREPSQLRQVAQPENLGLMGTPERDGQLSWLAPSQVQFTAPPPTTENPDGPVLLRSVNTTTDSTATPPSAVAEKNLPLWIQAAVRLGYRYLRIAAAGEPVASSSFEPRLALNSPCCCTQCGRVHPPVVDEYYFWLTDSRHFEAQIQDADWGATKEDPTSDWDRPDKLPGLLDWPAKRMVRLAWSRVHNGEFSTPQWSDGGAYVIDTGNPQLEFQGRSGDSLVFSITDAAPIPIGYSDPSPWGFRYDMPTDTTVVLPEVNAALTPGVTYPGGLDAYPFFVTFDPGAPLEPSTFSVATTVAAALRAHCRHEAALKWYELVFKPLENDNHWARCRDKEPPPPPPPGDPDNPTGGDQPIPLRSSRGRRNRDARVRASDRNLPARGTMDGPPVHTGTSDGPPVSTTGTSDGTSTHRGGTSDGTVDIVVRGPSDPQNPCCQTEKVSDAVLHQRSILLHYLETLAQFGDATMCGNSPEHFQKARLMFETMAHIMGLRPVTIYSQDDGKTVMTVATFVPRFAPLNPRLMNLYDLVEDRLASIHHCLSKARLALGKLHRDYSYFGDSKVVRGWQTLERFCEPEDCCCSCPRTPYRFLFLVQKALETAAEVRNLGGMLLAAFEKGDAEYLAALRAQHEHQMLELTREIREFEWREADWQIQALKKSKESAQAKRQYYADLIANGLIANEQGYVNLLNVSMGTRAAGNIVEAIGEIMNLIPDFTLGTAGIASTPVAVNQIPIGTKLAHAFSAAARILNTVADISGTSASLSLTEAGWDRREQDWIQQVLVLDIEIEQIQRQILGAQRRADVALRQLNNLEQQVEQSKQIQDFLRDKFTNHARYLFLQQETAAVHQQMYEVALCWAREAERAANLELGHQTRKYLPQRIWDNLNEGLMAGERLELALRQMEKSYSCQNRREYELSKHFSLRLHFPTAFLQLKATGACEIEIPEWMYDMDYPGQYMRRIKNVSATIPSVVGPYTGVHCRVTLLSSATRIDPTLLSVEECCNSHAKCKCGEHVGYDRVLEDRRFVHQSGALEAIATSTGQNDTGLFELNFRDERYLPFEYSGTISRWRIELPPENNQFDMESVSDFLLHFNYTSREGGDVLRCAAQKSVGCMLPGGGLRFFDLKQDMAEAWQRLKGHTEDGTCKLFELRMTRSMFPFLTGHRGVRIRRLDLFFEAPCAEPGRSHMVEFLPEHHLGHRHKGPCGCDRYFLTCVASEETPCLFHGTLEYPFDPLRDDRLKSLLGAFEFPPEVDRLYRGYIVCTYEAVESDRCLPKQDCCAYGDRQHQRREPQEYHGEHRDHHHQHSGEQTRHHR